MTEYDYSPAAYERYAAQQARVSNWVHDTVRQAQFSDPFLLSPTLRDRSFYDDPRRYHDQSSSGSSRPSRQRSRSYGDYAQYDRAPPRHRSQSHSRSPREVYPQSYMYAQPRAPAHAPAPRPHPSPPRNQYPSPPSRQAYVTQPPPGQIYHIPPNPPPVKETLYRQPSHTRHPSKPSQPYLLVQGGGPKAEYKRGPPIHAPIPIKPQGPQPQWFKRFFTGFKSPVGNGRGQRGY